MIEAETACFEWSRKKGAFRWQGNKNDYNFKIFSNNGKDIEYVKTMSIRSCRIEEETSQWLGYEYPFKEGTVLTDAPWWGAKKLVKRFRY